MYKIKAGENLQEGDIVVMNECGIIEKWNSIKATTNPIGVFNNNRVTMTCNPSSQSNWIKSQWMPEPEPLTPTQELCDLACEINGIAISICCNCKTHKPKIDETTKWTN